MAGWLATVRKRGLWAQLGFLSLVVAVAFVAIGPLAGSLRGEIGWAAAAVAGGVCLLGSGMALGVCGLFQSPEAAWIGTLAGMLPRMAIPLVAALLVHWKHETLAEAGFLYYLVVFYSLTLTVETIVLLPQIDATRRSGES